MRLTKTIYKREVIEKEIIGYQSNGRPIWKTETILTPIEAEVEPYSEKMAESMLGLLVSVSNRCFCYTNHGLVVGDIVMYRNLKHEITHILEYDRHSEVLMIYRY